MMDPKFFSAFLAGEVQRVPIATACSTWHAGAAAAGAAFGCMFARYAGGGEDCVKEVILLMTRNEMSASKWRRGEETVGSCVRMMWSVQE